MEIEQYCFGKQLDLFQNPNPKSSSSKMSPTCYSMDGNMLPELLPNSGIVSGGQLYPLRSLEQSFRVNAYSEWLRPTASDGIRLSEFSPESLMKVHADKKHGWSKARKNFATQFAQKYHHKPTKEDFAQIMGFPFGFTRLAGLRLSETASSTHWRKYVQGKLK